MALDLYLTIPGIPGESKSTFRLPGSAGTTPIDVQSYSAGISIPVQPGSQGSGSGAGKAQFSDLSITKYFDSASPLLMHALVTGERLKTVTLSLVNSGAKLRTAAYLTYEYQDVFVASIEDSAGGGTDRPEESVSFAFGQVTVTYYPQEATGGFGKALVFNWDVEKNIGK